MKKLLITCMVILCGIGVNAQYMQSSSLFSQKQVPTVQTVDFSYPQYDCNPMPWAIGLAAVSGITFTIGTGHVAYAFWYAQQPPKHPGEVQDIDLTGPANVIVGALYYVASIGTGIPAIILFKKAGKNAQASTSLACDSKPLFPNGVQCQLGIQPTCVGIKIDF